MSASHHRQFGELRQPAERVGVRQRPAVAQIQLRQTRCERHEPRKVFVRDRIELQDAHVAKHFLVDHFGGFGHVLEIEREVLESFGVRPQKPGP
jgi:hypothetical protein